MASPVQAQASDGTGEPAGTATAGHRPPPVPPRTPHEEAIVGFWQDVLGQAPIGVTDDFFDLDGDSLQAIQVIGRIRETWGVNIRARSFFESPTVAALAAAVTAGSATGRPAVGPRAADAEPVLSFDQQRLWLENQLTPETAYNVHNRQRLTGPLDVAALAASIRTILRRHESLRTRFPTVDGQPIQVVDDLDERWPLPVVDRAGGDLAAAIRLADEDAAAPFDLAQGPLFRCVLIRLSDTDHVLSITAHHIVCDAWSVALFARELAALYGAQGDPDRAGLPALPVQYRDFAVWQHQWLTREVLERQVTYWRRHLAGAPPALTLPTEWRPTTPAATGGRIRTTLSAAEATALHEVGRAYGATAFMVLLASQASVLSRWSGQRDVVIGVPITGRTDAGIENLIGFFVNTMPLRIDLSGGPTFAALLGRVRQAALGGYAHADAPLDLLVDELDVTRVPGRTPLFQVALNMVDVREVAPLTGVAAEAMEAPAVPSKFDLALTAVESADGLRLDLEFDTGRYRPAMIEVLLDHIVTMLRAVLADPTRDILDYALGDHPSAIASGAEPPAPVERSADRVAIVDRDGAWTYRQLQSAADGVARALALRGAAQDSAPVGIVRQPTAGFAAAVLGCRPAGVPVALLESGPDDSSVLDLGPGVAPIDVPALLRAAAPAHGPAGDPRVERFGLGPDDRCAVLGHRPGLLLSAVTGAFDAGATLVLAEHSLADGVAAVAGWLRDNAISVVFASPPIVRALAAVAPPVELPALRCVLVDNAGDLLSCDVEALRRLSPDARLVGVYHTTGGRAGAAYPVPATWAADTAPLRVPLGRELGREPAQLRHPSGQPATTGEVAELCFGGEPTGLLARRWTDGTLEYVGRIDTPGPVDPAETVGALRSAPGVRDSTVTIHIGDDGGPVIFGYVAGPDPAQDTDGIHRHVMTRLPEYLTPHRIVVLDRMPLTPAGEYDRSRLPRTGIGDARDTYVAPRTPVEQRLIEILHELLTADRIGVYDTIFRLGGSSLLATRLISRIRETFNVGVSLRELFESATVDRLAFLIVREQAALSDPDELAALLDEIEQ